MRTMSLCLLPYLLKSVGLQSLKKTLATSHTRGFISYLDIAGLLIREISWTLGLCLHRTAHYLGAKTSRHAFSGIRNHDTSIEGIKASATRRLLLLLTANVRHV
jgi:hypothetical protein